MVIFCVFKAWMIEDKIIEAAENDSEFKIGKK